MVVQRRCALIESASVPRIRKSEPLEVKMMAKFVAEGAHERAEGSDYLPLRRPHPHADQHGLRIVVAEKFTRPVFADSQRSGREKHDFALPSRNGAPFKAHAEVLNKVLDRADIVGDSSLSSQLAV